MSTRYVPCANGCGNYRQYRPSRPGTGLCATCYRPPKIDRNQHGEPGKCMRCGRPRNTRRPGTGLCRHCYMDGRAAKVHVDPKDVELTGGRWVPRRGVLVWQRDDAA